MSKVRTVTIKGMERIAVNKLAGIVTSPAKEIDLYEPDIILTQTVFDAPPKTKAVPSYLQDLTGSKRGKMTIVGYLGYIATSSYGRNNRHPPHKWLAKCVCGKYEIRDGSIWRKGLRKNTQDAGCCYCHNFENKKYELNNL
jgi:hypothetical protein